MRKPRAVVLAIATASVLVAACGGSDDKTVATPDDKPSASTTASTPKRPSNAPAWVEVTGAPIGQGGDAHRLDSDSEIDLTPGVASFKPAAPGAAVTVERKSGSGWVKVASGRQSTRGTFAFFAAAGTVTGSGGLPRLDRPGVRA